MVPPLFIHHDVQAAEHRVLSGRWVAVGVVAEARLQQRRLVDGCEEVAEAGHAAGAHVEDLGEGRRGVLVEAELGSVRGEERRHEAEGVIRIDLPEHGAAEPAVRDEDQVAQRLDERPLAVDALVQRRLGEVVRQLDRRSPHRLDGGPPFPQPRRGCGPHRHTFRVHAVEFGLDERADVHTVHLEVGDHAGQLGVDQHGVSDAHSRQVDVVHLRPGEVGMREPGATELVAVVHVDRHVATLGSSQLSR